MKPEEPDTASGSSSLVVLVVLEGVPSVELVWRGGRLPEVGGDVSYHEHSVSCSSALRHHSRVRTVRLRLDYENI